MDPPDICVYNPSDMWEPSQQELDVEDAAFVAAATKKPGKKGKKGKALISREAAEDKASDPENETYDPEDYEPEDAPEPTAKKPKRKLTAVVPVGTTASAEIEEVNSKKPPVKHGIESRLCPLCRSWNFVR